MCGRYLMTSSPEAMRRLFRYREQPNFPARYNIAPTQPVPIVRLHQGKRQFALVRWGLLPAWVKDPKKFSLLHVARGESVNEKPAFRNAMKRRRCLVPADGFYEWSELGERKRPFFIRAKSAGLIAFAGLWETWEGPNGEEVETVAIITTPANRLLGTIAERMPAILPPDAFELWLDCASVDAETGQVHLYQELAVPRPVDDARVTAAGTLHSVAASTSFTPSCCKVARTGPAWVATCGWSWAQAPRSWPTMPYWL